MRARAVGSLIASYGLLLVAAPTVIIVTPDGAERRDVSPSVEIQFQSKEDGPWVPLTDENIENSDKVKLGERLKALKKHGHELKVEVKPPAKVRVMDTHWFWGAQQVGDPIDIKCGADSFRKDDRCVKCTDGEYFDDGSKACKPCETIDNCQRVICSTQDKPKCEACASGYFVDNTGKCAPCKHETPEGCKSNSISCHDKNDATCECTCTCEKGFYDDDDTRDGTVKSSSKCTACEPLMHEGERSCRKGKVFCTDKYDSMCDEDGCEASYYHTKPDYKCKKCPGIDKCIEVTCISEVEQSCARCRARHRPKGDKCHPCTSNEPCSESSECPFEAAKITVTGGDTSGKDGRGGTAQLGGKPLRIRGVRYAPLPIGMSSTRITSIYDREYSALHERDLPWLLELADTLVVQPPLPGLASNVNTPFKRFRTFHSLLEEQKKGVNMIFAFSLVPYKRSLEDAKTTEEQIARDIVADLTNFAEKALRSLYCSTIAVALGPRPHAWEAELKLDRYVKLLKRLGVEIADVRDKLPKGLSVVWSVRLEDMMESSVASTLGELYGSPIGDKEKAGKEGGLVLIDVDDDHQLLRRFGKEGGPKLPPLAAPVFFVRLAGKTTSGNDRMGEVFDALGQSGAGFGGDRPLNLIIEPIDQWWMDAAGCPPHSPFSASSCDLQQGGLFQQFDQVDGRNCLMPKEELWTLTKEWGVREKVQTALARTREKAGDGPANPPDRVCSARTLIKPHEYLDLPMAMYESLTTLSRKPLGRFLHVRKRSPTRGVDDEQKGVAIAFFFGVLMTYIIMFVIGVVILLASGVAVITLVCELLSYCGTTTPSPGEQAALDEPIEVKAGNPVMKFKVKPVKPPAGDKDKAAKDFAESALQGHIHWQHEVIERMFQHECACTKADTKIVKMSALKALRARLLKPLIGELELDDGWEYTEAERFAELVRAKVVMSMMEQALHAPGRVAKVLNKLDPIKTVGSELEVDLGDLCELRMGLEMVDRGEINFDDMDDGDLETKTCFRESSGWWVLLDTVCHLHELLTVRCWLALIAYYRWRASQGGLDDKTCNVWHPVPAATEPAWRIFQTGVPCDSWKLDAYAAAIGYLVLFLSGIWQESPWRFRGGETFTWVPPLRWSLSAAVPLFFTFLDLTIGFEWMTCSVLPEWMPCSVLPDHGQFYLIVRPLVFFLVTLKLWKAPDWLISTLSETHKRGLKAFWSAVSGPLGVASFWLFHTFLTIQADQIATWRTVSMFTGMPWQEWTSGFNCNETCGLSSKSSVVETLLNYLFELNDNRHKLVAVCVVVAMTLVIRMSHTFKEIVRLTLSFVVLYLPLRALYTLAVECQSHLCAALAFSKILAYVYAAMTAASVSFALFFTLSTGSGFLLTVWGLRSTQPDAGAWRKPFKRIYGCGDSACDEIEKALLEDLKERHLLPQTWDRKKHDRQNLPAQGFPLAKHALDRLDASLNATDFSDHPMNKYEPEPKDESEPKHVSTPSLSQVVTVYNEDILYDDKTLRSASRSTGMLSLLEHLVYTQPAEWESFVASEDYIKDASKKTLVDKCVGTEQPRPVEVPLENRALSLLQAYLNHDDTKEEKCWDVMSKKIRYWASYRSQHASRTVRGAMAYHTVLKDRFQADSDDFAELVLSHQTYGQGKSYDKDVEDLLEKYAGHRMLVVHEYDRKNASPKIIERVKDFWRQTHGEDVSLGLKRSDGKIEPNTCRFEYATLVTKWDNGVKLVAVMPRQYPLRLGKGAFATQGKSANQLNALRCVSGHVLQVLDMNMDFFPSEALKVPQMLRNFYPDGAPEERQKGPKLNILGFREHVYTGVESSCGQVMANAEYAFGTIFQSALANALGVRLHYGHPDFVDVAYVLTHGGMSKASPDINLSEDAFLGYVNMLNALRDGTGARNDHKDVLEWQKGREVEFSSAAGFLHKIAGGAATMLRSRDLHRLYQQLDLFTKASLFMGAHGSYFSHLFSHLGVVGYACLYLCLVVSGLTASTLFSAPNNILQQPALPISTVVNVLPLVVQKLADGGPWEVYRLLKFELLFASYAASWHFGILPDLSVATKLAIGFILYVLPPATAFFGFGNRSLVASFVSSLETGRAGYVATGRPPPFKRVPLHQLYMRFAKSHYEPFVDLATLACLILLITREAGTAIRLGVLIGPMLLWVVAPVLFMPHPGSASLEMLQHFLVPVREAMMLVARRDDRLLTDKGDFIKEAPDKLDLSLMDWSAIHEHADFASTGRIIKLVRLTRAVLAAGGLWLVTPAIIKATVIYFQLAWCWFAFLTALFFCFDALRPFLQLWLLIGLPIVYTVFLRSVNFNMLDEPLDEATRLLWAAILHVMIGRIFYAAALFLANCTNIICDEWRKQDHVGRVLGELDEKAQKLAEASLVQILHVLSLQYLAVSVTAILVLACQSVCVCIFWALDELGGLHSWYLFNQRAMHARAPPLLAKGSPFRNDGPECWHAPEQRSDNTRDEQDSRIKKLDPSRHPSPIRRPATSPGKKKVK